jgi:DNA-directed RNA polymerase specialized sigma24 family protein
MEMTASRLARAAPGNEFEDFYRSQADRVYRALALTVCDPDLAREATDEAMARACARWSTVCQLDNPGGWVYRVGLNWATSWRRKVRRERPMLAGYEPADVTGPPDTPALHALAALDVNHRAVIVCRVLFDLSTAQTAVALGIAEGTVKSRLARALEKLRIVLTEETDHAR